MAKFKVGDKVEIINYGRAMWFNTTMEQLDGYKDLPLLKKEGDIEWRDIRKELIGRRGIIVKALKTQGVDEYSIDGVGAWYQNSQLKLKEDGQGTD